MDQFILTPYFLTERLDALESLAGPDWRVNAARPQTGETMADMTALHRALAADVALSLRAGHRPVSVAGDCCSAIAVAAGMQRAGIDYHLIWLDAHGDFNTWETTPSGFLGGMPLAMLVGRGEQTLLHNLGLAPLAEGRVILCDARDLDPGEAEAVAGSRVQHVKNTHDLLRADLPAGPLLVHVDTDVLDPSVAPAMNYLAAGGPTETQLHAVFSRLAQTGHVRAVSMSTWNPVLEGAAATRAACMRLLHTLLEG